MSPTARQTRSKSGNSKAGNSKAGPKQTPKTTPQKAAKKAGKAGKQNEDALDADDDNDGVAGLTAEEEALYWRLEARKKKASLVREKIRAGTHSIQRGEQTDATAWAIYCRHT